MKNRTDNSGFGPKLRFSKLGWILSGQCNQLTMNCDSNTTTNYPQTLFSLCKISKSNNEEHNNGSKINLNNLSTDVKEKYSTNLSINEGKNYLNSSFNTISNYKNEKILQNNFHNVNKMKKLEVLKRESKTTDKTSSSTNKFNFDVSSCYISLLWFIFVVINSNGLYRGEKKRC